jgi:predicted lipoprotein with Yx(FWY)xxD motif
VLLAAVGLAVAVAACGSTVTQSSSKPAGRVTVRTVTGKDGTYLTDGAGRALYMWVGDDVGKSNCSADCALAWPPVITDATPSAGGAAASADLGTITRSDGGRQATYKGHPLYYFVSDSGPGTTKGQGSNSFGAKWWLLAPSGAAVTAGAGSSVSPPTGY